VIGAHAVDAQVAILRQFVRFVIVGASNTLLSFACYAILVALSVPYVAAAAIAFAVGATNGYVFNRRWTFAVRGSARSRLMYAVVAAAGAAVMSAFVWLLVHEGDTGRIGGYVAAIPPVTVGTFAANRLWTFADRN
jgi:putative flippase GtrA